MSSPRYLWMAPNAGLWDAFKIEHRLAEGLALSGRSVTMLHCDGVLSSYCPVIASRRLSVGAADSEKRRACVDCRHNSRITGEVAAYDVDVLDRFVTAGIRQQASEIMAGITRENYSDLVVDGVPIGRYATYLALLQHKVPDVTSTPEAWLEYLTDLDNAIVMHLAAASIFEAFEPTHLIVYNPLYPVNRMMVEYAIAHGVQLVSVTAGSYVPARLDTVGIYPHLLAAQTITDSAPIMDSLSTPLSALEVHAVAGHVSALISGNDPWVYSVKPQQLSESEVRRRLSLRADSPTVTVLISSPDETRASRLVDAEIVRDPINGFSDIAEFLRSAVDAARSMPDVDFVFRMHPRLFPNKRESVLSLDFADIMRTLDDLPANAHVNVPADELSLYDVLRISSCGLNQSSSTGLEFMVFGIPVVQYDPIRMALYPPDFSHCVERGDTEGLVLAIREALADGGGLETSRRAFRWLGIILLRTLLHFRPIESYVRDASRNETTPPKSSATAPPARTGGVPWRRFVPESWRERGARYVDRRSRVTTLPDTADDRRWHEEFIARLDATVGGPIWNPPVMVRGESSSDAETSAIEEELARLRTYLGMRPSPAGRG